MKPNKEIKFLEEHYQALAGKLKEMEKEKHLREQEAADQERQVENLEAVTAIVKLLDPIASGRQVAILNAATALLGLPLTLKKIND